MNFLNSNFVFVFVFAFIFTFILFLPLLFVGVQTIGTIETKPIVPFVFETSDATENMKSLRIPSRMTSLRVQFKFKSDTLTFNLDDNPPAREFLAMLPLDLKVSDFASAEKIAYLPSKLGTKGVPEGTDARAGDLAYYAPWGNLALFYKQTSFARGLIRLGHVHGSIDSLKSQGEGTVRIEQVSDSDDSE